MPPAERARSKRTTPTSAVTIRPVAKADSKPAAEGAAEDSSVMRSQLPVFLRKTFTMIDTCPPGVGGWGKDGKTFVIKNPETFAAQIIPSFFRHNNFSSFVRQLNFYGFRKIKTDAVLNTPQEGKWWEFRHESFQRGRPELLVNILRRSNNTSATDKVPKAEKEIQELRGEVEKLRATQAMQTAEISNLRQQMQQTQLFMHFLSQQQSYASGATSGLLAGRAVSAGAAPTGASSAFPGASGPVSSVVPPSAPGVPVPAKSDDAADQAANKRRKVSDGATEQSQEAANLIMRLSSTGSVMGPNATRRDSDLGGFLSRQGSLMARQDSLGITDFMMSKVPSLGPLLGGGGGGGSFEGQEITRLNSLYDPALANPTTGTGSTSASASSSGPAGGAPLERQSATTGTA
mmetsp:Transcript_21714/g.66455  ORF Transcript_21714/g.66455 Transcript_21714/m.66455 type:complete len:404 (-) Transcript_21714:195-1406(-)|eukprot:CAMPEP_0118858730 /NCGR_PEP_ID=MMETSP1163-20130328/5276_1 /TAXON_ID=124430 /ORGANISM="Phaeomonas parva, Strain CCMP2877" /LENGTH=403 /DNA_ID=CAMNT_0006792217 /DNA_START=241 /DNA_END=1452 /DNA_ORIENTATION=+